MDDLIFRQAAIDAVTKWDRLEFYLPVYFKQLLESLPSARLWTPCSERLPNKDGNYIVTLSYTEGFKFSFVDIDNFSVYEHQWDVYGSDVIAWMPLPQAWEGE